MTSARSAPRPPPDLDRRKLVIEHLPAGMPLYRFHSKEHGATYFDCGSSGRFNAGDGSFGIMYAAIERCGAFAETFLRNIGATGLSEAFVEAKTCATFTLGRPLRAVRLRGHGLAPIGATAGVCSSPPPYLLPQAWSRAIYVHPDRPDAILYASRHDDDQPCLAIFDRAADSLGSAVGTASLLQELWFYELMELYGVGLL